MGVIVVNKPLTVILPNDKILEVIAQIPEPIQNECFDVDFYEVGDNHGATVFIRAFARLAPDTTPFVQIKITLGQVDYIERFEIDDEWLIYATGVD